MIFTTCGILGTILVSEMAATPPTVQDIRQAATNARSQIADIKVEVLGQADRPLNGYLFQSKHIATTTCDRRIYIENPTNILFDAEGKPQSHLSSVYAFDGEKSVTIGERAQSAAYELGQTVFARTSSVEWFQLNLFNPGFESETQQPVADLVWLLSQPLATVRPEPITVKGIECYVVDIRSKVGEVDPKISVWVAESRGWAPVKWCLNKPEGDPSIMYTADEMQEVLPGVWVAVSGDKKVFARKSIPGGMDWRIEVEKSATGERKLELNTSPDPKIFSPIIPSGYTVRDENNNVYKQP